ncbi:caspase-7-like isoform X1 [Siniperca chuatsi]|uniref:caspase-7-like isoform X1 n=1 Tax=Siniperca chuatsi TaxID=119488 RepID=UPI001CE1382D|nr:caspase-7-like isoform X1 [Siniperca chuatsi]
MLQWRGLMDHGGDCNRAVLVSVAEFDHGVKLGRRPGAERDAKRLHRSLSKLGFKVDIHTDLGSEEIYELFLKESRRPVKDCFLAVFSSHGEEGCVFGADGKPVRLARIFRYFDNEYMEKKAKVFLIQACRGHDLDDGVEVDSAGDTTEGSFSQHLSVPVDTAVMYATAPGYGAFMHPLGSVFLQTFCTLLEEEGNRNLELTRLMTRLSHRVAYTFQAKGPVLGGKKEMPCLLHRLTREVFPFAKPGKGSGAVGLSATSLVSTDNVRRRTPSIS